MNRHPQTPNKPINGKQNRIKLPSEIQRQKYKLEGKAKLMKQIQNGSSKKLDDSRAYSKTKLMCHIL